MLNEYSLLQSKNTKKQLYNIGDKIIVIKGDYNNLTGTVVNVSAQQSSVVMKADNPKLANHEITLNISEITKHLKLGERVVVVDGMYKGTVGIIESINGKMASIVSFTDNMDKIINVFVNNLKKDTIDKQGTLDVENLSYKKDDFVQLLNGQVGIVLWHQRDKVTLFTQDGEKKSVLNEEIDFKRENKRVTTQNHSS